eukprot:s7621_g2.t1
MAEDALQEDGAAENVEEDRFQMPWAVATFSEYNQRAYMLDHQNQDAAAHWLYPYVHNYLGLQAKLSRSLSNQRKSLDAFLATCECADEQVHRCTQERRLGQTTEFPWKVSTVESTAYLLYLTWVLQLKSVSPATKHRSLQLLLGMLDLALKAAAATHRTVQVSVNLVSGEGIAVNVPLHFSDQGLCFDDWASLLRHSPGACHLWEKLRRTLWQNRCISTQKEQASLSDIWFFLAYILAHKSEKVLGQNLYRDVGLKIMPLLALAAGAWMNKLVKLKSAERLKSLPLLRNKAGNLLKSVDPVSRMILLWRLRKHKTRRAQVSDSHEDLCTPGMEWLRREAHVDAALHLLTLKNAMADHPPQIALSWDPASYGGREIMVVTGYSQHLQKSFYCMNQWITGVRLSDLDNSLLQHARGNKIQRVDGYNEIRGLAKALEGLGMCWDDFKPPAGVVLRPLKADELRIHDPDTGKAYIYNCITKTAVPEIPHGFDMATVPALISARILFQCKAL